MSAREELAQSIATNLDRTFGKRDFGPATQDYALADALLAEGWGKRRTVATVEELDALPVGSVVRTSGVEHECEPRVATKDGFWTNESEWFVADGSEWCLSSDELDDLPATVLYEPQS